MDDKSRIALDIPDPEDFEDPPPHVYIPVPCAVVDLGIELLQCILVQRKQEEGLEPDDEVWDRLAVSAAQMLSGLTGAWGAYYHGSRVRALVAQIDHYCNERDVTECYDSETRKRRADLAALRAHAQYAPIVDALEALRSERQNSGKEQQQQPAAEQGPAADHDPGWEF
jgi:hypothetical protein